MTRQFSIGGCRIGGDAPPFVIAEAGVNHNGDPELAVRLVDAAADAGATAVKFQTFSTDELAVADAPQARYQTQRALEANQREMLRRLELSADSHAVLQARARARGILFFSTPFDLPSVELLLSLGVPALKIGSGDLTNAILLRHAASAGLPLIVSTGMATLQEVEAAVAVVAAAGDPPYALLHATSAYPARVEDANLRAMDTLRDRFDVPVGLSDHTPGLVAAIAAVARGAAIVEKHLTLDRTLPGPDHAASLEPAKFAELVFAVRAAHAALGDGEKRPRPEEIDTMRVARRSLVASRRLEAGSVLADGDLTAKRPGTGLSPVLVDAVLGRRLRRVIDADELLSAEDLDPPLADSSIG